jgi:hypothetical protein
VNRYFLPLHQDIAALQTREIDPGNHFAVHHQQQAVPHQEFRHISVAVLARNDLIHGVAHGLQTLEFLNLTNHSRLIHVDGGTFSAQHAHQA